MPKPRCLNSALKKYAASVPAPVKPPAATPLTKTVDLSGHSPAFAQAHGKPFEGKQFPNQDIAPIRAYRAVSDSFKNLAAPSQPAGPANPSTPVLSMAGPSMGGGTSTPNNSAALGLTTTTTGGSAPPTAAVKPPVQSAPQNPISFAANPNMSAQDMRSAMTGAPTSSLPANIAAMPQQAAPQQTPAAPTPAGPQPTTPLTSVPSPAMSAAEPQQPAGTNSQFSTMTTGTEPVAGDPNSWSNRDRNGDGVADDKEPGYFSVLDRWYNPWTKQQTTERGEESLKGWGQTAMGVGVGAAATAAAIPAAAAAGLTAGAGGAMTAGGTAATLGAEVGLPVALEGARQAMGGTETPPPAETPSAETAQGEKLPYAAGGPGGVASTGAGATAPKTPEQQQQANTDLTVKLNDPNVSDNDKKQAAQQHVQQMLDSNPEMKQGMADLHAGKDTPQAKAFQAEVDKAGNAYVREEFARLKAENPGASAQQQGGFLQSAMQGYQSMPEPMKWMMGLGLGGGLIGILGSLFGGGGGMGMLGLLGLGAAGLAGAAGGMFGQGAQDALGGMVGQLGQATGMIPKDIDLSGLKGDDAVARATQASGGGGILGGLKAWWDPKGTAEKVQGQLGQADQLQRLMMVPEGMRPALLRQISPNSSPQEIQQMLNNANQMNTAMNDPNHQLGQNVQRGRQFVQDPTAYVNNAASEYYNPAKWDVMPWNWGGKTSADYGHELAANWAKEADEKATQEWLRKFRARGQGGRWVNTRRGSKTEKRIKSRLQPAH